MLLIIDEFADLLREKTSKFSMEQTGLFDLRFSHKNRAVKPDVKMKLQQHLQQLLFSADISGFNGVLEWF